jgi:hypothetical protein
MLSSVLNSAGSSHEERINFVRKIQSYTLSLWLFLAIGLVVITGYLSYVSGRASHYTDVNGDWKSCLFEPNYAVLPIDELGNLFNSFIFYGPSNDTIYSGNIPDCADTGFLTSSYRRQTDIIWSFCQFSHICLLQHDIIHTAWSNCYISLLESSRFAPTLVKISHILTTRFKHQDGYSLLDFLVCGAHYCL